MPSYKTAFPSKFLKAEDLGTTRPIGSIATVDFEDVGIGPNKDRKLVVHFKEPALKPLVLNMINGDTIAELADTEDYEQWPGCRLQLFATKTEFQGKRVPCIRIGAPPVPTTKRPTKPSTAPEPNDPTPTTDDGEEDVF